VQRRILALLEGFAKVDEGAYELARQIVAGIALQRPLRPITREENILFLFSIALSGKALREYATLDSEHIRDIDTVLGAIRRYAVDQSLKRPLNFLMLASPGAGKSHFIRCIASELGTDNIGAVTYNMVGLQRYEDLIPALDAARNFKVDDRMPLLFLDEFDVRKEILPILLPLLWDGQITIGQHDLKLGKVVIVLAGSDPELPVAMEYARNMRADLPHTQAHPKLIDLLSRINGGALRIPLIADARTRPERAADKICIAIGLLRRRFGACLERIPISVLRFIAVTEFRYGVRSIAHLIDLIPYEKDIRELTLAQLRLPFNSAQELKNSSFVYHTLCDDQAHGVVAEWNSALASPQQIAIWNSNMDLLSNIGYEREFATGFVFDRLSNELGSADT
jgi:hypothetical protein